MTEYVIRITRSIAPHPSEFFGDGWNVWVGSPHGNGLRNEGEVLKNSSDFTNIDLSKVRFFAPVESAVSMEGRERYVRLQKVNGIFLDPQVLFHVLRYRVAPPRDWDGKNIFFDGGYLEDPDGKCCVAGMCQFDGVWAPFCKEFFHPSFYAHEVSAILPSD